MYVPSEQAASPVSSIFSSIRPSLPPAIVGLILFALSAIYLYHREKRSITKVPRYIHLLLMAATLETVGYILRVVNHVQTPNTAKYVVMNVFQLLGPNSLALVNYNAIGRVLRLCHAIEDPKYLQPKFVSYSFIVSHIVAVALQVGGVAVQASANNLAKLNTGRTLTLTGLSVQLFFFICFAVITLYIYQSPKYNYAIVGRTNAKGKAVFCLFASTIFFCIRAVYRIAVSALGPTSSAAKAEWASYIFDALMVLFALIVYCIFYPGDYIPENGAMLGVSDEEANKHRNTGDTEGFYEMDNRLPH